MFEKIPFVIIGSGAAGSVLASEFGKLKIRTLILEQGPYLHPKDITNDPIKMKYDNPLFAKSPHHKLFYTRQATQRITERPAPWGACVGGSTVHFGANALRFHEEDFKQRTVSGNVKGADVQNWPFSYKELSHYYDRVEHEVGISGKMLVNPFEPKYERDYPMPPYPRSSAGAIFEIASKSLGLHPFPTPKFINTKFYDNRPACTYQGLCSGYACQVDAKGSALVTLIPKALQTGSIKLETEAKVTQILHNNQGKVISVIYIDKHFREKKVLAEKVFICANPIESIRLLLLSTSARYPNGLLNNNGLVGRYLMRQTISGLYSLHPHSMGYSGNIMTRRAEDYFNQRDNYDFSGGFLLTEQQQFLPTNTQLPATPFDPEIRWGKEKVKFMRNYPNNIMTWLAVGSCIAQYENRVTLYEETDAWGLKTPLIIFDFHDNDKKLMALQRKVLNQLADQSDAMRTWSASSPELQRLGPLFSGGCRMGVNPDASIVNEYGQSHELSNLYIMGSAIFPTSGRDAPTQTIMALAYRLASHVTRT